MKTTDSRDPLDRRIDQLLASRPVAPQADFVDRVMDLSGANQAAGTAPSPRLWLRVAMPLAAALAVGLAALVLLQDRTSQAPDLAAAALSETEIAEILLLEESLSGLAAYSESNGADPSFLEILANDYPLTQS